MSIPMVFRPVYIDGRALIDGGLTANIPVTIARELGAERVIVSDVTEHLLPDTLDLDSPTEMAKALTSSLFRQPGDTLLPHDIYIRPEVDGFPKLDFSPEKRDDLIERGYTATLDALVSSRCVSPLPGARSAAGPSSPVRSDADNRAASSRSSGSRSERPSIHDPAELSRIRHTLRDWGERPQFDALWINPVAGDQGIVLRPELIPAA